MKKMRMCFPREKTFEDGFKEYILDCKARNLRDGTIIHYQESIKQIYKRIPPDTPISSMNKQTMADFYIALREDPDLNEVTMGTYARDLKTLMRFFMKCQYIPHFEIQLPKADKPCFCKRYNEPLFVNMGGVFQEPQDRRPLFSFCVAHTPTKWHFCFKRRFSRLSSFQ